MILDNSFSTYLRGVDLPVIRASGRHASPNLRYHDTNLVLHGLNQQREDQPH